MVETYVLAPTSIQSLQRHLPDNVFPIKLQISLSPSPRNTPLKYEIQQSDGMIYTKKFTGSKHSFPVYEDTVVYIPNRVVSFINPLEMQSIKGETKQQRRSDTLGEAYENDEQAIFSDFLDDLELAKESISNSSQPKVAERIYMSHFRICIVPRKCVVEDPDATDKYENVGIKVNGYGFPEEEMLYSDIDHKECWIATFSQAADMDSKINTGHAKNTSQAADVISPGKMTVPSILTNLKRVYTHGLQGRDMSKLRCAYFKSKAEVNAKNKDSRFYPREWEANGEQNTKRLVANFDEGFTDLIDQSEKDDYPLLRRIKMDGKIRNRSIFDVDDIREIE